MRLTENIVCGPQNNDELIFKGISAGYVTNVDYSYSRSEWRCAIRFRLDQKFEHLAYEILKEFRQAQVYATYETDTDLDPQVSCKGGQWVIEMRSN